MKCEKNFEKYLKLKGRSQRTIQGYTSTLDLYFKEGYKWNYESLCLWKENQMKKCKPTTVNTRLHALNAYSEYKKSGWKLSPLHLQTPPYVNNQLTVKNYQKLCSCLYEDGESTWYAVIRILGCTGVRISEFFQIRYEDIQTGYVDIIGKGNKARRVWFPSRIRKEIAEKCKSEGYILQCTPSHIRKKLHYFAQKYDIPKGPMHPHEFRAFFARNFYARCKDLKLLQDVLGHSNIQTTMRYLRKSSTGISRKISNIVTW